MIIPVAQGLLRMYSLETAIFMNRLSTAATDLYCWSYGIS